MYLGTGSHDGPGKLVPGNDGQGRRELAFQDVQVGAADSARRDLDHDLSRTWDRILGRDDLDLTDAFYQDGTHYFTAPMDSPRTSFPCADQPAISTGRQAIVAAADRGARNGPSGWTKPTRKIGTVAALIVVRLTARKNSFQENIKQMSAAAARPGLMIGMMTDRNWRNTPAPSTRAA